MYLNSLRKNSQIEECSCFCNCICDTCLGNTVKSACMVTVCLACGREGLAALRCAALCSAELCLWSTHLMQTTASVMGVRLRSEERQRRALPVLKLVVTEKPG